MTRGVTIRAVRTSGIALGVSRPWYLAWGETVYIVAALATLVWIVATGRRRA